MESLNSQRHGQRESLWFLQQCPNNQLPIMYSAFLLDPQNPRGPYPRYELNQRNFEFSFTAWIVLLKKCPNTLVVFTWCIDGIHNMPISPGQRLLSHFGDEVG